MKQEFPLLSARLCVDYLNKPLVLRDLHLEIQRGEILGLVGQSGSGKSTLALALFRLLHLKGGQVRGQALFNGEDLLSKAEGQLRSIRGRLMSVVLQSPLTSLNPALRIGTQLAEAWYAHVESSGEECLTAIRQALTNVSLPDNDDFLRRRPSQLSVGQAQRVTIAMAILHRPALLIADEATSALDSITQAEILQLFARLNHEMEMAILFISHDLLSVAALCHRIAILKDGCIVECGSPEQIFCWPQSDYTRKLIDALPSSPFRAAPVKESKPSNATELASNVGVRCS